MPRVRCSLLFLLLAVFAAVSGNLVSFLIYLAAVLLHECAHGLMAAMLGCRVETVDIMPYGCAAGISGMSAPADELAITLAGPLFSILAYMGCRYAPDARVAEFARANMYIAAVNLLPAYPLDGGRGLGALLRILDIRVAPWVRTALPMGFGAAMLMLGAAAANVTLTVFGIFLIFSAITLKRGTRLAENHMRRLRAIASGRAVKVRHLAISADASIGAALMCAGGGSYVVFCLLDEDMREITRIDGVRLMELAARLGTDKKIRDVLRFVDRMPH